MQSEARSKRLEAVSTHPLVELLACPPSTSSLLTASAQTVTFAAGEVVFTQSSACQGLYLVISGQLLRRAERLSMRVTLGMARSNVSNSLKELLTWRLIRRVPVLGDRRDHFEAETDLWQMATKVAQGRKAREIDPMVAAIRDAMVQLKADDAGVSPQVKKRLASMHEFVTTVDDWYQQMLHVPPETLMRLIRMGAKVVGLLGLAGRGRAAPPG